jgi:hypothetical protein
MKKLLILAIALTFCLVIYVCIYYMLSAARVPVLTFSPSNEVEVCTLYPLCIKKTGTGIFIYPDALHLGGLHVGGPFEPAETPRPTSPPAPTTVSISTPTLVRQADTPMPVPTSPPAPTTVSISTPTLVRQADTPMPVPTTTAKIWQPPSTYTPTPLHSPTPTPTPSCDLTVYLRGTNNAEGFAAFSGEHVDAGSIYTEGAYVYGEVALRIGDSEYHYYEQRELPRLVLLHAYPYGMEFQFSDSLSAATKGVRPSFDERGLRFWAGILDCNSATPPDKPYKIEVTLYKEGEIRKHTEISFLVADNPLCGVEAEEPEGIPIPTPRGRPRPP